MTNPPAPPQARPRRWERALPETTPAPPRPTPAPMKWWAAYGLYAAMFVIVFSEWPVWALEVVGWSPPPKLTGDVTLDNAASAAAWHWSTHAVLVLVVLGIALAVTRSRGLRLSDIGVRPRWVRTSDREERQRWRRQARRVFWWMLAAFAVATLLRGVLTAVLPEAWGDPADASPPDGAVEAAKLSIILALTTAPLAVSTSWIEEAVNVALLAILGDAARRPTWELIAVAAVAKTAYHLTSGWAVIAVAVPAAAGIWLWRRTGRLTPIMAAHAAHNLAVSAVMLTAGTALMMT